MNIMNINIICVGKLKEKYLKDAIAEYSKRLQRFCNLKIVEINEAQLSENYSEAEKEIAVAKADADRQANDARINAERESAIKNNELEIQKADLKKQSDT